MFWFISYCIGIGLTSGTILGANAYAREADIDEPFDFGDMHDDGPVVKYVGAMALWPLAWVTFVVARTFRALGRRHKRRIKAAQERQRLLDAPIED